jgi:hypothetical protein
VSFFGRLRERATGAIDGRRKTAERTAADGPRSKWEQRCRKTAMAVVDLAESENTLTNPRAGNLSDKVLSPGEFVDVLFSICLKDENPFSFFVDVLWLQTDNLSNSVSK